MIISRIKTLIFRIHRLFYKKVIKFPLISYPLKIINRKRNYFLYTREFRKIISSEINNITFSYNHQKLRLPSRAAIEINNTCNLNCIMCNTKLSTRTPGNMNPKIFELILKELSKIGINKVALHTVGEPFIYKNLEILFQIIRRHNFKVNLSTNGQFPKKINEILKKFSDVINYIRFSIDGAIPKTYEIIRRGGKYSKLIESLEVVRKFNRNLKDYKVKLRIDAVLSTTNINEIPLFFKKYGRYCYPESINFNLINGLSPDTKHFYKVFPFPNLIRKAVPCPLPFNYISFTYDGKVTLCCRDYNGDLIVGDLNENSLIRIWDGDAAESLRNQHLNPKNLRIRACKKCYETYPFVSDIVNIYIHFLYLQDPNLSEQEYSQKILFLLKDMDDAMKKKDKLLLKKNILNYFMN